MACCSTDRQVPTRLIPAATGSARLAVPASESGVMKDEPDRRGGIRTRLLVALAAVAAATAIAFAADAVLSPDVSEGTNLSDLTFDLFDGGTGTISDYEGTPLVVNFFASWCPPCVREMPEFQDVFESLEGRVAFLGLSQDSSTQAALDLVERTGVTYDVGWDLDLEVYEAPESIAMPTTAFVSPDGELLDTFAGVLDAEALAELVENVLLVAARP